ncbi:MAG: hypothetical protein HZB92_03415 [Euryarchaeota archaeon]|nr:hypothetical protein [Euryarchaeota archaeon]
MGTMNDYWDSVNYFCALCKKELSDAFVSFIVTGSLSVGDIVPGWSDVDAFLVAKSGDASIDAKVKGLVDRVTEKYPFYSTDRGSMFCVMVATLDEVLGMKGEVSFLTQWDLKRHGAVACGADIKGDIPEPPLDKEWLDNNTDWMIDFLSREKDNSPFWKGRNAIGFIIAGARNAILKRGKYAKAKDEIERAFGQMFPGKVELVSRAMECRWRWGEIQEDGKLIEALYDDASLFLKWVRAME